MKKWNKKALALLGLGAATLVGGTFAYYNQTVSLDNPLGTGKYENELVEDYTPPTEDVKPGATIAKKVGAKNTGDYPVMVRIRMDEKWTRVVLDADGKPTNQTTPVESLSQTNGSNNLPIFNIADTAYNEGNDQQKLWQATQPGDETESNGLTANDNTVVRKNLGDSTKWIYNAADGYWYYYKILGIENNKVNVDEIKQAYREQAKKYHPDVNVGDRISEERFKDINEAYKTLSVPASKRKYDRVWNSHFMKQQKAFSDKDEKNRIINMFLGDIDKKEIYLKRLYG